MKKTILVCLVALSGILLWSCNKNQVSSAEEEMSVGAARLSADTTGFFCRDSLTKLNVSALPASITTYISANYTGATVDYAAKDDAGNFWVAITVNDERKALLFNADGTFSKEASLHGRKGHGPGDKGPGHGPKGKGGDRDSLSKVTIANLPSAITTYITTNYTSATIVTAALDSARGYLVMIKQDSGKKTLLFNLDGTFVQEIVRSPGKNYTPVEITTLPAAITSYITTNYAGSTIKVAGKNSSGQYKVLIETTNKRPVVLIFAADGTFIQVQKGH